MMIRFARRNPVGETADRLLQAVGVGEQRRDVLEPDAGGREVVHLTDQAAKVEGAHLLPHLPHLAPEQQRAELLRQLGQRL